MSNVGVRIIKFHNTIFSDIKICLLAEVSKYMFSEVSKVSIRFKTLILLFIPSVKPFVLLYLKLLRMYPNQTKIIEEYSQKIKNRYFCQRNSDVFSNVVFLNSPGVMPIIFLNRTLKFGISLNPQAYAASFT